MISIGGILPESYWSLNAWMSLSGELAVKNRRLEQLDKRKPRFAPIQENRGTFLDQRGFDEIGVIHEVRLDRRDDGNELKLIVGMRGKGVAVERQQQVRGAGF